MPNTNRYHRPPEETEAEFSEFLLNELEQAILAMGPETVCLGHGARAECRRLLHAARGLLARVREICDRYGILLSADEVITAFGRLGHWFGSERYDIRPDIVTIAKGLSSSYGAIGGVVATERVMEPFMERRYGITFGGHPVMAAIALKNIEIMKRERIPSTYVRTRTHSAQPSRSSWTFRSSATCAGRVTSRRRARQGQGRGRRSRTMSARGSCGDTSRPPSGTRA